MKHVSIRDTPPPLSSSVHRIDQVTEKPSKYNHGHMTIGLQRYAPHNNNYSVHPPPPISSVGIKKIVIENKDVGIACQMYKAPSCDSGLYTWHATLTLIYVFSLTNTCSCTFSPLDRVYHHL